MCRTQPPSFSVCHVQPHCFNMCRTQPHSFNTYHTQPSSSTCVTLNHLASTCHTQPPSFDTCHTQPSSFNTWHTQPSSFNTCHTQPSSFNTWHTQPPSFNMSYSTTRPSWDPCSEMQTDDCQTENLWHFDAAQVGKEMWKQQAFLRSKHIKYSNERLLSTTRTTRCKFSGKSPSSGHKTRPKQQWKG